MICFCVFLLVFTTYSPYDATATTQNREGYNDEYILKEMPKKGGKDFGHKRTVDGGFRKMTVSYDDLSDYSTMMLSELKVIWLTRARDRVEEELCTRECA